MELFRHLLETWHALENIHPSQNPYSVHEPVYQASLLSITESLLCNNNTYAIEWDIHMWPYVVETHFLKTKFRSLALLTSLQPMINALNGNRRENGKKVFKCYPGMAN